MPTLEEDVQRLREALPPLPEPSLHPSLVLVSGLPGTGKSYFSRRLAERAPLLVLETDALRRALVAEPTYSAVESNRLFQAVHELLALLLGEGVSVVLDATNLVERHREVLYNIAEQAGAQLLIVRTEAVAEVVGQRLEERAQSAVREDASEADAAVYRKMRSSAQQIRRNHFVVDTTGDIEPVLQRVLREVRRWNRV